MRTPSLLEGWLTHLRELLPPNGIVHAGAGIGLAAARYADWQIARVLFVEADESLASKLDSTLLGREGWTARTALLGDNEGEVDFYLASNPDESGLLKPESLAVLWRNLRTREQRRLQASTVEALLSETADSNAAFNWSVIDCLPALPILRGAGPYLDRWDVVIARVLLDENQLPGRGATKSEVDTFLLARGYRCLATEEERQPMVGHALYVRDWKYVLQTRLDQLNGENIRRTGEVQQKIAQLNSAFDEQIQLMDDLKAQLKQSAKELDSQTRLASEYKAEQERLAKSRDEQADLIAQAEQQIKKVTDAHSEQTALVRELQMQREQLAADLEKQAGLVRELEVKVEQLIESRDEQSRLATERTVQVQQILQERNAANKLLSETRGDLEKAIKARDEQTRLVSDRNVQLEKITKGYEERSKLVQAKQAEIERQATLLRDSHTRIAQLEAQIADMDKRQTLLSEEMVRAEGQIDMIKFVLLRETQA